MTKDILTDIFEYKILCKNCDVEMKPLELIQNGFILRAIKCGNCGHQIVHPNDGKEYNNFMNLRKKQFNVKMRFVGNSYAVSIPKEIVDFIKDHEKIMDNMVKLCFEEFGRVRLDFGCYNGDCGDEREVRERKGEGEIENVVDNELKNEGNNKDSRIKNKVEEVA